jgi:hypothetical protein
MRSASIHQSLFPYTSLAPSSPSSPIFCCPKPTPLSMPALLSARVVTEDESLRARNAMGPRESAEESTALSGLRTPSRVLRYILHVIRCITPTFKKPRRALKPSTAFGAKQNRPIVVVDTTIIVLVVFIPVYSAVSEYVSLDVLRDDQRTGSMLAHLSVTSARRRASGDRRQRPSAHCAS